MLKNMYNVGKHSVQMQMAALRKLKQPEHSPVVTYLECKLVEYSETLKKATSQEDVFRLQGRIYALEDMLELITQLNEANG